MASESTETTPRKHNRSPSDEDNYENESENPSKRRKHRHRRHHKHHHRHRHHNRSSKREGKVEDSTEPEVEVEDKGIDENDDVGVVNSVSYQAPAGATSGEVAPGSILGINYDDMEEGEIVEDDEAVDASQRRQKPDSCLPSVESLNEEDGKSGKVGESKLSSKDDGNLVRAKHMDLTQERPSRVVEHVANGDMGGYLNDDLPREEYSQRNKGYDVESINRDKRAEMLAEDDRKKHRGLSSSPSQEMPHVKSRGRSGLKSPDQSRGRSRSRSQSVFREGSLSDTLRAHEDGYHSKRKHRSDSDDEMVESIRDSRHGMKDLPRDKEREYSPYSRRNSGADRHHSRETRDKDREGSRDLDRDRRRERERDRDGVRAKEKEREQERGRDTVRDRERERERDRDSLRDRERERERERDRDRIRERERERHREWEREKERRRERDRESSRDRYRDRDEKYFRQSKYNDGADLERHDDYKRRRYDEISNKDRLRENEPEKTDSLKANLSGRESEKTRRDENEQEDYQEKVVLQLAEQEEDDLEKIKEESRRRRQAILEKYKTQNLQQPQPEQLTEKEQVEQRPLTVASQTTDDRIDGTDDYVADPSFSVGKSPPPNGISAFEKPSDTGGLGAGTPKSERSDDMFCDDIFGESPAGVRRTGKGDSLAIERSGQHDNWDDPEGYYSYRFGEILDGRYEIIAAHGKGVFSMVVRAKDLKAKSGDPEEVAIKMIRSNETMYKAGMEELVILKKLVGADPENKRHCVRFLSSFKYRNHLCLVFESLHMNLREVLKKFGRNIGLKLTAVRAYAKQLFIALKHLKNCGVLHCDIKPDNMLVNEAKNVLKLCDFGNAMFAGKNEITPYLVSRFYRAPEIILGLPYDHPMDMWSVGCCLFEIYSGKVLFPGPTNNDMLRLQMELKGLFPKKMVRKGAFKDQHFDQNLNFLATEEDPVTKKAVRRAILNVKPKDFGTLILGSPGEDPKMLANFKDLLEKIFMLDPDKRITVSQALSHPFITGK